MEYCQRTGGGLGTALLRRSCPNARWCALTSIPSTQHSGLATRISDGALHTLRSGSLRGNVLLGVGLHYTRLFVCLQIFPLLPDHGVTYTVLLAWAITEVARYPFYIAPSPFTATVRYACPVATFPIGAGKTAMHSKAHHSAGHDRTASLSNSQDRISVRLCACKRTGCAHRSGGLRLLPGSADAGLHATCSTDSPGPGRISDSGQCDRWDVGLPSDDLQGTERSRVENKD